MIFNIITEYHKLQYEEVREDKPDIRYYMEMEEWTASCFDLGLSAKDENESTALEELKTKIAENKNIPIEEIEFHVSQSNDDW
jgi:hypothetical protein